MLPFELTKDTPYLALSGELWSVFYEYFNRNWPCYKGFLLYYGFLMPKNWMVNAVLKCFHSNFQPTKMLYWGSCFPACLAVSHIFWPSTNWPIANYGKSTFGMPITAELRYSRRCTPSDRYWNATAIETVSITLICTCTYTNSDRSCVNAVLVRQIDQRCPNQCDIIGTWVHGAIPIAVLFWLSFVFMI